MVGGRGIAANASSGIAVALLVPVVFVSALYVFSLCVGLLAVSYSIIAGSGLPDFHLPTLRDLSSGFTMMFWSAATPCAAAFVAVSLSRCGSLSRRGLLGVLVVAALVGIAIDASGNFGAIHTKHRLVGVGHIVVAPLVVLAVWLIHGLSGGFVLERGTRGLPDSIRRTIESGRGTIHAVLVAATVWFSELLGQLWTAVVRSAPAIVDRARNVGAATEGITRAGAALAQRYGLTDLHGGVLVVTVLILLGPPLVWFVLHAPYILMAPHSMPWLSDVMAKP